MICRLCLITVNAENKVSLFNGYDPNDENHIVKLITKYFHIEVTPYDSISATICQDCCLKLSEFHKFFTFVEEKQNTFRKEVQFLDVQGDPLENAEESSAVIQVSNETSFNIEDILEEPVEMQLKYEVEAEEINIFPDFAFVADNNVITNTENEIEEDKTISLPVMNKHDEESMTDTDEDDFKDDDESWASNVSDSDAEMIRDIASDDNNGGECKIITRSRKSNDAQCNNTNPDDNSAVSRDSIQEKTTNRKKEPEEEKQASDDQIVRYTTRVMDDFINQHMELKCDLCDTRFEKYSEVRAHYRKQHNRNEYIRCCGNRFNKRRELYDHINWHLDPEYFKCDVCGRLMKNRSCLNQHKMAKHQKIEDLIFKCDHCQKRFARVSLLNNHVKTTHEAKRKFACKQCDKKFAVKHALVKHTQSMHDNIFPHICDVCGIKFKFKPSFITHILEHQGIVSPPVKCPECGEWVKNQNRLRLHLTTHNKVDVDCKYCGRVCASLSAMRAHIQYMHRRPPSYKCTYCDKFFKTPKILKEHIATHTGEILYRCPHCLKEFRSSANMYVHIKRQHTQEWLETKLARRREPPKVGNEIIR